jgi:hemerythrin-like domain-containing protein
MDALDLLEQQHRDVRELLERLALEANGASTRESIDAALRAVEAHVRIEEAYVYIACASKLRGEERAVQANEERAGILSVLRSLRATHPSDPHFSVHVATLSERFSRHVDMEEDAIFPKLKRTLTDEALDVLGEVLVRAHQRLLLEDKPSLEMEPLRMSRRSMHTPREPGSRRNTIVRSGVRQKIRPTSLR